MDKLAQCSYFESKSSRAGSPEQEGYCLLQYKRKIWLNISICVSEPVNTERGGEDHRRIEPTNSFDSSEHSATPSLYTATNANNVNGSNQQQEQPQSQRYPSPPINFLQEDQTVASHRKIIFFACFLPNFLKLEIFLV